MTELMRPDLPTGTVTFLFTDVEGSTRLLHQLGEEDYAAALAEHRRLVRDAFAAHDGVEVDTQGDAFFFAFPTAEGALVAAAAARDGLTAGPIRLRMGIHTGTPHLASEGYVGSDVHLGARIAAAGHGGQVLLSRQTRELADVEVSDLGEHRLKDFAEPIWIYQLGSERFPPLRTISNTNLPRPASTFVGRDFEVEAVASLLHDHARLVTLTGPGGSGKTRLAIEAAATLVPDFKAGVFWVGLATLRDPALVTETIGQTIGATDGLAEHIGEREMLLVLDNLEQVIEAAPELTTLVEACANVRLLVTSRERLRVRGEIEYPVLPLADPDAVALFCARARMDPTEEIHAVCRRLDNLPLAIELAAARSDILTPAQLIDRLSGRLDLLRGGRDADPRQQTLRATVEWSHELLSADEQRLFAQLAVFAGGCTLEAAETVVDADLDALQSLVARSLLRHTGGRFWMLETIREFAIERIEGSGEADGLRRRHAGYFLALAEEAEPHAESDAVWIRRLEAELDNFRAAMDWSEASSETQLALRMAGALLPFWDGGHVGEGRSRLERLLARDEQSNGPRAKALVAAAVLARQSGDPASAIQRAREALAISSEGDDRRGIAIATLYLGLALGDEGDFSAARQLFEDCIELFRKANDELNALFASRLLAWAVEELGDRERAWGLIEHNLGWARALGDKNMEAQTLGAYAGMALDQGRAADAVTSLQEVLRIDRDVGAAFQTALDLTRFARALAVLGGSDADAAALLSCAEALRQEIGAGTWPFMAKIHEEALATIRTRLDEAAIADGWMRGAKLSADEAVALALGEVARDAP
jgi:predicted ATPase/class 3 adenylate cyclase